MKQNLGVLVVLLGCILLMVHAFAHLGNGILFAGFGIEIIGILLQIFLNYKR